MNSGERPNRRIFLRRAAGAAAAGFVIGAAGGNIADDLKSGGEGGQGVPKQPNDTPVFSGEEGEFADYGGDSYSGGEWSMQGSGVQEYDKERDKVPGNNRMWVTEEAKAALALHRGIVDLESNGNLILAKGVDVTETIDPPPDKEGSFSLEYKQAASEGGVARAQKEGEEVVAALSLDKSYIAVTYADEKGVGEMITIRRDYSAHGVAVFRSKIGNTRKEE